MTTLTTPRIPLIAGLRDLAAGYDVLFCDIWGVLHNGARVYDGVVDALTAFRENGGHVVLLSNSPRPSGGIPEQLESFGVPHRIYDGIVTSGDATRAAMASGVHGDRCFHLGPERDLLLFEDVAVDRVAPERADFILCSGLFDDATETPEDYEDRLQEYRRRGLEMLCANPDIVVHRGDNLIFCAGALAERYRQIGGNVHLFGKPHQPVYDLAQRMATTLAGAPVDRSRILAVGDGLKTDLLGARSYGVESLFVTGGISAADLGRDVMSPDPKRIEALCSAEGVEPIAALPRLVW